MTQRIERSDRIESVQLLSRGSVNRFDSPREAIEMLTQLLERCIDPRLRDARAQAESPSCFGHTQAFEPVRQHQRSVGFFQC